MNESHAHSGSKGTFLSKDCLSSDKSTLFWYIFGICLERKDDLKKKKMNFVFFVKRSKMLTFSPLKCFF